jgi:DNA-binding IclR family transcriptional regulator
MGKTVRSTYFVPALEKGLDILECLASAGVPQTLADLARTLNRTSSELFRMIDALEKRSYIVRDPATGAYSLTLKLYELAHTHSPVDQILRAALLPMRQLVATLHETCLISVVSEGQLVVIAQEESPEPVRLSVEVGSTMLPLHTTSGVLLLSFMEAESRDALLESDPMYVKMSRPQRRKLFEQFAKIRKQSWHFAPSTRRTGLDLSCFVGNSSARVAAALAVPFLAGGRHEGKERRALPTVLKSARQITASLGLTPEATVIQS